MPLKGNLKPDTLYITLDSRPLRDEYHWALVTTDASCHATLRHASNLNGPWKREEKDFRPDERMMLITLVRVGDISDQEKMVEATRSVPVDGLPSSRTLEESARKCAALYAEAAETGHGATVVDNPLTI
ncbi:hypothetical protein Daesc_009663 [Daldinia eschscholtzii]|uniref:Uncharacterized protein n=1 Tax=Daldinia eschscholtzii TaxID=292717 RepID=A0AAX6MAA5_9PEZI